jgi:mRNA interferase MazF
MWLRRGDIVLVPFPNSDLTVGKKRPALIVQADDLRTGISQLVAAMISSNPKRAGHPSRVFLPMGSPQATGSGLLADSVVMTDNLATMDLKLFRRRLGSLRDMSAVDAALRATLSLP